MLRVFVALGKQMPKCNAMIGDTAEVGKMLAKYNCTLVQGGAKTGLMGVVLTEFQKYSDDVVLIVPEVHKSDLEGTASKEHYIVEGEADRLKITINTCDLIIVLPGGTGTMAELNYYNETCKSGEHSAKIVMVNTKGFYNKLFKFINHQTKVGFMKKEDFKFEVINNVKQLEGIIEQLIAKKQDGVQSEMAETDTEELVEDVEEIAEIEQVEEVNKKTEKAKVKAVAKKDKEVKVDKPKASKSKAKEEKPVKTKVEKVEEPKKTAKKTTTTKVTKQPKAKKDVNSPAKEVKTTKLSKPATKSTKTTSKEEKPKTTKKTTVKTTKKTTK